MILIAIYARQSIDKKDSLSIETQVEKCKKEAEDTYTIFVDKGFSGKNTNRPEFQKMLEQVREGKIHRILVYRIDRFSRSIADFGAIWETLQKYGVDFVSINEKFDTATPIGRAMLYIVMSFAQLERETIAERIKDNYYTRLENGTWVGGPAPFGFVIQKIVQNGKKASVLEQNEKSEVVKEIFKFYENAETSLGDVVDYLNQHQIPCGKRKSWDHVAVSRILHNPIYAQCDFNMYAYFLSKGVQIRCAPESFDGIHAGMLIGKRQRGEGKYCQSNQQYFAIAFHKGVITSEQWILCNEKLDRNKQISNKGRGKYTWLSGLLRCGKCGYSLKVIVSKGRKYLICSGRTNYHICKEKLEVSIESLEDTIQKELECLFSQVELKEENVRDVSTEHRKKEIEKKIVRLVEAIAENDTASLPYLKQKIRDLQKEKDDLLDAVEMDSQKTSKMKLNFSLLDFEGKKYLAAQCINFIKIVGDTATIYWKV